MALQYLTKILHEVHEREVNEREAREQRQRENPMAYTLDDELKPYLRSYDERFKNMNNPLRR